MKALPLLFICFALSAKEWTHTYPQQTYMNEVKGVPTPAATPQTEGSRLIVTGDFLWWIARENSLEYVLNADLLTYTLATQPEDTTGSSLGGNTRVQKPQFQWDPGFRVGIGYRIPHDSWEGKANWTRFHTSASDSSSLSNAPNNQNFGVYLDGYTWNTTVSTNPATAQWYLDYDLFEIGLSRSLFLGKNLSLDLRLGAAGGWIDQKYTIHYPSVSNATAPHPIDNFSLRFKNNFQGGGLFLSMAPQWDLWRRISILGHVNAYLLHGSFDIHQNWFNTSLDSSDESIHKNYSRNRAGFNGKLGLQWETSPLNHSYHFALSLAYEGTIWFKQNLLSQTITFFYENLERRGDLEMQGITLSARADF
jgi:hypothetical protein